MSFNFFCNIFQRGFKPGTHLGRGKLCQHFQCFDLEVFFESNRKGELNSSWKCPVCGKRSTEVLRDKYFEAIFDFFQ